MTAYWNQWDSVEMDSMRGADYPCHDDDHDDDHDDQEEAENIYCPKCLDIGCDYCSYSD